MQKEVDAALAILKKGGLILYPTDTVWAIGCDATNADAVEKIFRLKNETPKNGLTCIVSDFRMLQQYVEEIPEVAYDILKYAVKPTTIIYDDPIRVAENLIAVDNTLAIRVCRNKFCNSLLKKLKRPIVSTSANVSGKTLPSNFNEISNDIKTGVDYIVNLDHDKKSSKLSALIKLTNSGKVTVIRS